MRDFKVVTLHKSLLEFLCGQELGCGERAPAHLIVDVAAGERRWAEHCVRLAVGHRDLLAPVDDYALRYVLHHTAAAQEWDLLRRSLLDFDLWERAFRDTSLEFVLAEDAEAAMRTAAAFADSAAEGVAGAEDATEGARRAALAAADVLRWLRAVGRFLRREPLAVLQQALATPPSSAVAAAARSFHREPAEVLINPPRWWPATRLTVEGFPVERVPAVCFTPDGGLIVAATAFEARMIDAGTGEVRAPGSLTAVLLSHAPISAESPRFGFNARP